MRDISPMQAQALMTSLTEKSNSLQSKVLIVLRSIFKVAQENGLVAKSPVSSMLKAGGKKTEEKVALTPGESKLLLERVSISVQKPFYTLLCIQVCAGAKLLASSGKTSTLTRESFTSATTQ